MKPAIRHPGVSGLSLYVPRPRVRLDRWAEWTGAEPDKLSAVVGRSFRVCPPGENAYTMAANAVLDLIRAYEVDPSEIGFLALGTESSTDNAAGAVVVRGMLDDALESLGLPALPRACEVPEFKHACLGGVYGLKAAARYLAFDGWQKRAIVVSADIAEYERGSTGEQTQGAGAVAMLLDAEPKLFELSLSEAGSASAYRGVDFRKPFARHRDPSYAARTQRPHDFPIFNGRYSTLCYVDATARAVDAMFDRIEGSREAFFDGLAAVLCHRPYQHMPLQAMAAVLVWSIAREGGADALAPWCQAAGVEPQSVLREIGAGPDLFGTLREHGPDADPMPAFGRVVKAYRRSEAFDRFAEGKLSLGAEIVRDLGNLYTASLPAWIGAAFEDALHRDLPLAGRTMLALGYGSGDAAESIPLRVVDGWQEAAARIGMRHALNDAIDLDRESYEALHDGHPTQVDDAARGFVVERVGDRYDPEFQDLGIDYYAYRG